MILSIEQGERVFTQFRALVCGGLYGEVGRMQNGIH
jgi:hypothetical protein